MAKSVSFESKKELLIELQAAGLDYQKITPSNMLQPMINARTGEVIYTIKDKEN